MSEAVDYLRWVAIWLCAFNLGAFAAVYERVGALFLPKWPMRMIAFGWCAQVVFLGIDLYFRVGQEFSWRIVAAGLALICQLIGLVLVYLWYRTPQGKEHVRLLFHASTLPLEGEVPPPELHSSP